MFSQRKRMTTMKYLLLVLALPLAACTTKTTPPDAPTPPHVAGMANPASVHCINAGGKLEIRTGASGGQYGICHMPDGKSCEEWSLFRTGN